MVNDTYIRYVDNRGRITLPYDVRSKMGLYEGAAAQLYVNSRGVLCITKYKSGSGLSARLSELQEDVMAASADIPDSDLGEIFDHLSALNVLLQKTDKK